MSKEVSRISDSRARLLPLLRQELSKSGFLSREVMSGVCKQIGLPPNEIYGVSTFYSYLPLCKTGKNIIRVCRCLPCELRGAPAIIDSIQEELEIALGEVTADGKFSFELVNCIGACDQAPAMMINDQLYGDLTPDRVVAILGSY